MEVDLDPKLVCDEVTFLAFVQALAQDCRLASEVDEGEHGAPRGWQNESIDSFLDAAVAWAHDSNFGRRQGLPEDSPWRRFAVFLYCGKIYE
jgi:hypothetical protein